MSELVLADFSDRIGIVTLNRAERHNSLVPELLQGILQTLDDLRRQPELRAVVLQANGRSFSTGGDVRAFYNHLQDIEAYAQTVVGLLNQVILAFLDFPVPIVAAVHGIVTGGSLGLVLASDIVLVAPEANFTPYYSAVGYSPDGGWTALLPTLIGARRAAEVLMLNQTITADQAVAWGVGSRIVAAGQVRQEARAVAGRIAGQAAGSVRSAKRLLATGDPRVAIRLEEERQHFVRQIATAEAREGMVAFLERGSGR
ncbi:MAG: enoyl-CoA hydratase/isomerase family protein [Ardenticatenaceae bacterium]|nr:enoyl-CoA hydratase/isomerase family protein [Ardenticatenaceae bacterium]HBY96269.1 enoyl-CoA hydratase [Chloroflexota bacterium]